MADVGDRISVLPDEILNEILSLLSIKESVGTSILSSRWRHLYSTNPVLHFCLSSSSVPIVDRRLLLSSPLSKLRSICFTLDRPEHFSALHRWIRFAADRKVEQLTIFPRSPVPLRFEIPTTLFECRSLSTLEIQGCSFAAAAVPFGSQNFPSLKTLVLCYVNISNDSLSALLSLCPCLETLSLSRCRHLTQLVILSPMMRSLTVHDCRSLERFEVVCAPQLRRIMYNGDLLVVGSLEGLENLEEAAMISSKWHPFRDRRPWRRLISCVAHVKILSINSWFFEFLPKECDFGSKMVFNKLKELHWWTTFEHLSEASNSAGRLTDTSLRSLISCLRDCPFLELLCLHLAYYIEAERESDSRNNSLCMNAMNDYMGGGLSVDSINKSFDQERAKIDPLQEFKGVGYSLPHLKTVKLIEFSGEKEEVRLVEFLLDKAVELVSMILYYVPELDGKLREMHREIDPLPKASPLAHVYFIEDPLVACPKHDVGWWQSIMFY